MVDPGPGALFTMWGFFILLTVYIEAYGLLFEERFHIPVIGRWDALGFLQDFFATAVFLGITTFAIIRILRNPARSVGAPGSTDRTTAARGSSC